MRFHVYGVPVKLIELLKAHRPRPGCKLVFPSPTGNREYHMLDHCKAVAKRAGLDEAQFDLKTFRSTYATRTLRTGFDVRTVQHWMGHKSLETTMRYLVPSKEVHARLDQLLCQVLTSVRKRQRFVIPSCDEGVKALKQGWSGWTVGPPYPPLDYSRF